MNTDLISMPVSIGLRAVPSAVLANAVAAAGGYAASSDFDNAEEYGLLPYYQHHQNHLYHHSVTAPPISSFSQYHPYSSSHHFQNSAMGNNNRIESITTLNLSGSDDGSGCDIAVPASSCSGGDHMRRDETTFTSNGSSPSALRPRSAEEDQQKSNAVENNAIQNSSNDPLGKMMEQSNTERSIAVSPSEYQQTNNNNHSIYNENDHTVTGQHSYPRADTTHSHAHHLAMSRNSFGVPSSSLNLINNPTSIPDGLYSTETSLSAALQKSTFGMPTGTTCGNTDGPGLSYATLTPLQPLPSISTASEKYGVPPNGGFINPHDVSGIGDIAGNYQKMTGMGQSLPPLSNHMLINGLNVQHGLQPSPVVPTETEAVETSIASVCPMGIPQYARSPTNFPSSHPYEPHMLDHCLDTFSQNQIPSSVFSARPGGFNHHGHSFNNARSPGMSHSRENKIPVGTGRLTPANLNGGSQHQQPTEEVNTKEVAAKITQELKRYSIPQAIFAQRVLCRSQGTLSDLLRNPKPWSKLKSGRETFRRMWKWLQEPEFQRMSALRLAGRPFSCYEVKYVLVM